MLVNPAPLIAPAIVSASPAAPAAVNVIVLDEYVPFKL